MKTFNKGDTVLVREGMYTGLRGIVHDVTEHHFVDVVTDDEMRRFYFVQLQKLAAAPKPPKLRSIDDPWDW